MIGTHGKILALVGKNTVYLIDATTLQSIIQISSLKNLVFKLVLSPCGNLVAITSRDQLVLFNLKTNRPVGSKLVHSWNIRDLRFDPEGKLLLTGCHDGSIWLWNVPQPVQGSDNRIVLWAQVITGKELNDEGKVVPLDAGQWELRRRQLNELVGINR